MKKMLIALTMLAMASVASADVIINFNYRNYTADLTNTYGGSVWNEIDNDDEPGTTPTTRNNLRDSTGAALSGVVMTNSTTADSMWTPDANAVTWATAPANVSWVTTDAGVWDTAQEGLGGSAGQTYSISLSGLNSSYKWTVRVFSAHDDNQSQDADWTVEGSTVTAFDADANEAAGAANAVDMQWTNITLTDGILNISVTADPNERMPGINAIQVEGVVVPEPATVGMLGLGALVSLLIRRIRG